MSAQAQPPLSVRTHDKFRKIRCLRKLSTLDKPPLTADVFYGRPLKETEPDTWASSRQVQNKLSTRLHEMGRVAPPNLHIYIFPSQIYTMFAQVLPFHDTRGWFAHKKLSLPYKYYSSTGCLFCDQRKMFKGGLYNNLYAMFLVK